MQTQADILSILAASMPTRSGVVIVYRDGDGIISTRSIAPTTIAHCRSTGGVIVRAFDLNREAPRTFRAERIIAAAPATGALLDHLDALGGW